MKTLVEYIFEAMTPLIELYRFMVRRNGKRDFRFTKPVMRKRQLLFCFTDAYTALEIIKNEYVYGQPVTQLRWFPKKHTLCIGYDKETVEQQINTFVDDEVDCFVVIGTDAVQCVNKKTKQRQYFFVQGNEKVCGAFQCIYDKQGNVMRYDRIDEKHGQYFEFNDMLSSLKHEIYNKANVEI